MSSESEYAGSTDESAFGSSPTRGGTLTIEDQTGDYGGLDPTQDAPSPAPNVWDEREGSEVVIALPPREAGEDGEYQEIVLSGSAALDALDQLMANNEIGREKAAKLRRKYNTLRETLESSRNIESTLLDKAKVLSHQLAYQKRVLERTAAFPDGSNTQGGNLRQVLLTHQNEIDLCEARLNKLEQEKLMLEREHNILEKEYNRQPKKEELEQHIKEIGKSVDGLNDEISLRSQDIQRLNTDIDRRNYKISLIKQETDDLHQMQDILQQELIAVRNGPNIPKEIDTVKRHHRETLEKIRETDQLLQELADQTGEAEERCYNAKVECSEMAAQLQKEKDLQIEKEVGLEQMSKYIMMAKEREANLQEDKATLEIRKKHRSIEAKALFDALAFKTKEKDKELKSLKKGDLQLASLRQSKDQVSRQANSLDDTRAAQMHAYETFISSKSALVREVQMLRLGLKQMEGLTEADQLRLNKKMSVEEAAKKYLKDERNKLNEIHKDIVTMTKARDQESRLYYQTLKEHRALVGEMQIKEGLKTEQHKKLRDLNAELMDFTAAYEVVKTERNRTHSQIVMLHQLNAELSEKAKILNNEVEILSVTAADKEKILQKCSLVYSAKVMERDMHRQELDKLRASQDDVNSELQSEREAINKLTCQINSMEEQLNKLRRRYERTVQERNDLGLQLIERNEEVCVFYEKLNVHESIIREANLKFNAREEELKLLNVELKRIQNSILVYHKQLPGTENVSAELTSAQAELKSCEQHMRHLEKAVEDSSNPNRTRLLPGVNPTRKELNEKLDKVEGQLAECEQQLLEKELLYEQVGKLTDKANKKVEGQRSSTLTVARKVNNYQAKIKDMTRKMMALVSELSMQQASALGLEQETKDQEAKLQQAYIQLENGEAPDDQALVQWEKKMQREYRKEQDTIAKINSLEEERSRLLPGGTLTTAASRPNAYIPSGDKELPIPKPYGNQAPFKPSQTGSNFRHIRKPQPHPIDI